MPASKMAPFEGERRKRQRPDPETEGGDDSDESESDSSGSSLSTSSSSDSSDESSEEERRRHKAKKAKKAKRAKKAKKAKRAKQRRDKTDRTLKVVEDQAVKRVEKLKYVDNREENRRLPASSGERLPQQYRSERNVTAEEHSHKRQHQQDSERIPQEHARRKQVEEPYSSKPEKRHHHHHHNAEQPKEHTKYERHEDLSSIRDNDRNFTKDEKKYHEGHRSDRYNDHDNEDPHREYRNKNKNYVNEEQRFPKSSSYKNEHRYEHDPPPSHGRGRGGKQNDYNEVHRHNIDRGEQSYDKPRQQHRQSENYYKGKDRNEYSTNRERNYDDKYQSRHDGPPPPKRRYDESTEDNNAPLDRHQSNRNRMRQRSPQPDRDRNIQRENDQPSTSYTREPADRKRKFSPRKRDWNNKNDDENKTFEWGKKENNPAKDKPVQDPAQKDKPNFGLSGKLTEDTNTVNGVVLKYSEPPEGRKPKRRWRFYPFKGETTLPILYIHRQSCFLLGRDRMVADIPLDHPSVSKQHAVLQYRLVPFKRDDGSMGKRVRPYIIDLGSANGTFVNNKQIEPSKYVELLEKDVVKFGFSQREYVLLHENSKEESDDDDDVKPTIKCEDDDNKNKKIKVEPID